jgi:hypothetical protein
MESIRSKRPECHRVHAGGNQARRPAANRIDPAAGARPAGLADGGNAWIVAENRKPRRHVMLARFDWLLAALLLVCLGVMFAPDASAQESSVVGVWKLQSWVRQESATGKKVDVLGSDPVGYITYTREGRMMALIVAGKRVAAAKTDADRIALYNSMLAYSGTYEVNGTTVTHHVDISWNQSFTGTTQVRFVTVEGDTLVIRTAETPSPIDGSMGAAIITWERVKAAK